MYHAHPILRLIEAGLASAAIGIGNAQLWRLILPALPQWAVWLIAVPSALLLMALATGTQHSLTDRHRSHARPEPTTRKAA